jgi:tripartite ATP-independent transporter DctM subunit
MFVMIGVLSLGLFLAMMFLGIPLPFAMIIAGTIGIAIIKSPQIAVDMISQDIYNNFTSYALTVSVSFGLMGYIASYTGIGSQMFGAVNSVIGHKRGGLAMATQVACAGFGAICGSPPACIATMCAIAYPQMRKMNYSPSLAGACIAAGATMSVLIPPSGNFIVYALATNTSVGELFMAGFIPGLMLTVLNIIAIAYIGKRHPDWAPSSPRKSWPERWFAIKHGSIVEILAVFIVAMGGLFAGFFTPTEAGAVGCFGVFLIALFERKLNIKRLLYALGDGVRMHAMVLMLLASATVFGKMFTVSTIPVVLGNFVDRLNVPNYVIMFAILIIYFLLGMITDLLTMTLVTMPIFFPIVTDMLGYDPIWFGVIITMMIAIGGITPPVGTGIFIVKGCVRDDKQATISALYAGVWPFVVASSAATILMLFVPEICMLLPNLIYG